MTPNQRPEPAFLCPLIEGHADRLRVLLDRVSTGLATIPERQQVREAVLVLLSDREQWDGYVTEETQERMRYLFTNQADLPLEALQWIVTTNREGTPG